MPHCECEHSGHASKGFYGLQEESKNRQQHGLFPLNRTPAGMIGHVEDQCFPVVVEVHTISGTFQVCPDCAGDCLHEKHGFLTKVEIRKRRKAEAR